MSQRSSNIQSFSAGQSSINLRDHLKDEKWKKVLSAEFDKDYFKQLEKQLQQEYSAGKEIFPPKDLIFNAFNLTPLDKVFKSVLDKFPEKIGCMLYAYSRDRDHMIVYLHPSSLISMFVIHSLYLKDPGPHRSVQF